MKSSVAVVEGGAARVCDEQYLIGVSPVCYGCFL